MKINRNGFTLIEILLIVAIIGLLASIILVVWAIAAQNKAAVAGYKTSMESVRTAAEMCVISGGIVTPGSSGSPICYFDGLPGSEKYPQLHKKCQGLDFGVGSSPRTGRWMVTTTLDNPCGGCRLECDTLSCEPADGYEEGCS